MCVWLEALVLGRCVGLYVLIPRCSACNECVFCYWLGPEFAVSDKCCRETSVIGPGEGECMLVQRVCVSAADDVRVASVLHGMSGDGGVRCVSLWHGILGGV